MAGTNPPLTTTAPNSELMHVGAAAEVVTPLNALSEGVSAKSATAKHVVPKYFSFEKPLFVVLVIVGIALMLLLKWSSSSFWEKHWGDVASVVGLGLSIAGFLLTIGIASQTRSAAEKAEAAATNARNSLFHFDAIVEVSRAITIRDEITELHRRNEWKSLPTRYMSIRLLLVNIKCATSSLSDLQRATIAGVLTQLNSIASKIESAIHSGKGAAPPRQMPLLEIVKDQRDHLITLMAELKQSRS
jgi:hypothetical protein